MTKKLAYVCLFLSILIVPNAAFSQLPSAPDPQSASISGYVVDTDGAAIPHAKVNAVGGAPSGLTSTLSVTAVRFVNALLQEFVYGTLSSHPKH